MTETKIELDLEAMRKIKLFIATPMYGGMCYGLYTKALMDTTSAWLTHGMQHEIYYLFNESINWKHIIGTFLVVLGLLVINSGNN